MSASSVSLLLDDADIAKFRSHGISLVIRKYSRSFDFILGDTNQQNSKSTAKKFAQIRKYTFGRNHAEAQLLQFVGKLRGIIQIFHNCRQILPPKSFETSLLEDEL